MIVFGYVRQYQYANDGTLLIQVRVPQIHGPYNITETRGIQLKTYTQDDDLPWCQSVLLPHLPVQGEVVMLSSMNETANNWVVLGLTGASYSSQKG